MKILVFTLFLAQIAYGQIWQASYTENWSRHPSAPVIFEILKGRFPLSSLKYSKCLHLDEKNKTLLGDSNPSSGAPVQTQPGPSFVEWYSNCLAELVANELEALSVTQFPAGRIGTQQEFIKLLTQMYGTTVINVCVGNDTSTRFYAKLSACERSQFTDDQWHQVLTDQLFFLYGDADYLSDRGFGSGGKVLFEALDQFYRDQYLPARQGGLKIGPLENKNPNHVIEILAFNKYLVLALDDMKF